VSPEAWQSGFESSEYVASSFRWPSEVNSSISGARCRSVTATRDGNTSWPDQYPILKSAGGHLDPDNVRLAHLLCNQRDYGWRTKIKAMLAKQMTLEVIAERLNQKGEPTPPGVTSWTAAVVRAAFVS
jgi:hypothetical protein